jgi:hypothetical protein
MTANRKTIAALRPLLLLTLPCLLVACSSPAFTLRLRVDVSTLDRGTAFDEGIYSGSELESLKYKAGSQLKPAKNAKVLITLDFGGQELRLVQDKTDTHKAIVIDARSSSFQALTAVKMTVLVPGVGKTDRWYQIKKEDTDLSIHAVVKEKTP